MGHPSNLSEKDTVSCSLISLEGHLSCSSSYHIIRSFESFLTRLNDSFDPTMTCQHGGWHAPHMSHCWLISLLCSSKQNICYIFYCCLETSEYMTTAFILNILYTLYYIKNAIYTYSDLNIQLLWACFLLYMIFSWRHQVRKVNVIPLSWCQNIQKHPGGKNYT